jgi:large subunit ribosomal protein L23
MNEKNYFDILVSPVITEKSSMLSESNKVVFKVGMKSSKSDIKKSIEELFN